LQRTLRLERGSYAPRKKMISKKKGRSRRQKAKDLRRGTGRKRTSLPRLHFTGKEGKPKGTRGGRGSDKVLETTPEEKGLLEEEVYLKKEQ